MKRIAARNPLDRSRKKIATRVRELRLARKLTQHELAARLDLSQNRLSEIERGDGSFTAEQFLELLSLFNVHPVDFVDDHLDPARELQNALVRLGATHLQESPIVTSGELEEVNAAVREALITGSPRLVTALAPVLANHAGHVSLTKLYADLHEIGLGHRLAWAVENTVAALDTLSDDPEGDAKHWSKVKRRAAVPFRLFLDLVESRGPTEKLDAAIDPLDPTIRTIRTLEDVKGSASPISTRWRIATSLRPEDFAQALRDSRAAS